MSLRNEDGAALVLVLLLLIVGTVLVGALLSSARNHINITVHEEAMSKAFYSADSGVEFVRANIEEIIKLETIDEGYYLNNSEEHIEIDNEEFWITFDDSEDIKFKIKVDKYDGNSINLISTGQYNNYNQEIEVVYSLGSGNGGFLGVTENNEVYNFNIDDIPNNFGDNYLGKVKHGDNVHDGELTGITWNESKGKISLTGERFGSGGGHGRFNLYESGLEENLNWEGSNIQNASHLDDIIWIEDERYYSITHQGILFENSGSGWNRILRQNDWNNNPSPNNQRNKKLAYGKSNNTLVMIEEGGNAFYYDIDNGDSDYINDIYDDIYDITYGDGKFVAVGYDSSDSWGEIYYSDDGKDWSSITLASWEYKAVTWTGEKFVAVGDSGQIAISNNGKDWNEPDRVTVPYTRNLSNVAGDGNLVIASSEDPFNHESGTMIVSTDGGETWEGYDGSEYDNIPKFKEIISVGTGGSNDLSFISWEQK